MKVVIIGGVAAGMSCAAKLRRLDEAAEIVVYEKTDTISYSACGIPYYVGKTVKDIKKLLVRKVQDFEKDNIKVYLNKEVISIDTENKEIEILDLKKDQKARESYDVLVIGTGANPIRPKIEGIDLENIYNVKSIKDGINIRKALEEMKKKNVVIIGGGYIGMEMVEAVHNWGYNITLVEMGEHILNGFDPEISEIVEEYLQEEGVDIKLKEEVKSFSGETKESAKHATKGATKESTKDATQKSDEGKDKVAVKKVITDKNEYETELVILGLGFLPATGFLKDSKIEMDDRGAIIIDRHMKTNIKDVYAAGDCAQVYNEILKKNSYIPLGTNANKQGKHLAGVINGRKEKIQGTLGSAVVKIMDMEVGKTGLSEREAKDEKIDYGKSFIKSSTGPEYYPHSEEIYVKIIYNQDNRQIIGGQVAGKREAGIRTDILAAAIYKKMTIDELGMLDLCYAPPFSNVWDAVSLAAKIAEKK